MNHSANPMSLIEVQEIIQKLRAHGFSDIVDCLLDNERDCYTKKGRLNKSSTCRRLDWKGKKLEDALQQMKELVGPDFGLELELDDEESEED